MRYRKGTFITVPNKDALEGLDPQTQVLYMWLNHYANEDGECYPSIETLSKCCGMTKNTVLDRINKLVEIGFIKKQNQYKENRQTTNLYTIEFIGEGAGDALGGSKRCTPGGAGDGYRTQPIGTQSILTGISKEIQIEHSLDENKRSSVTKRKTLAEEEYQVVPVNEHGDQISPRKKPATWDAEKAVFQQFSNQCQREVGVLPEPASLWQLKRIRVVMQTFDQRQLKDLFDDWFSTASDDQILNVHAALSTHNLNKFKMQK